MPRILILHASVGTGHRRAAEALAMAFGSDPTIDVRVEDVLDHTPKLFRLAYARSYLELSDRAPLVWGYFYSQSYGDPEMAEVTNNIRKLVESIGTNGLKDLLRSFRPDMIVCTHFLPMELLVRLKRSARLSQPVFCVVTDYVAHTFWTYTEIDGYFVSDAQTRRQLIERGVNPQIINVTGIPIDLRCNEPKSPVHVRREHNLPLTEHVVTVFGGGLDNTHVRTIARGLLMSQLSGELVLVAGRNTSLAANLRDLLPGPNLAVRVLDHVDYVDDLIVASDLVITKAGGLIVSELLARGTPSILIDPIPGHEEWNADFVVANGAGVQLRMAESVTPTVLRLLACPQELNRMREQAQQIGRPKAALTIAEQLLHTYQQRLLGVAV